MRFKVFPILVTVTSLLIPVLPAQADEYFSLYNQDYLNNNPQGYCTDTSGQQAQRDMSGFTQNDRGSENEAGNESHQNSYNHNMQVGGGGGATVLGTGGNAHFNYSTGEGRSEANSSGYSTGNAWDEGRQEFRDGSTMNTTVIGKDCNSFNNAAAARDIAHMNLEAQAMNLEAQARGDQFQWFMGVGR